MADQTAPRRRRRPYEDPELAAAIARLIRALGKRVSDDVDGLELLVGLEAELDAALAAAARGCHAAGWSWTDIGDRLGVTRQAARQRFAA